MAQEPSAVEQAVSRAMRDNLAPLQRAVEELQQAVADLVAACSSSRPTNALPPMLRAQTAAASLAATLEVLSRFITTALRAREETAAEEKEEKVLRVVAVPAPKPSPPPAMPPPTTPIPKAGAQAIAAGDAAQDMIAEGAPVAAAETEEALAEPLAEPRIAHAAEPEPAVEALAAFDLASLPPEQQELHRRANRVAKVTMQDIKMLRPEQVRLGREHKDVCVRLRNDIDRARKEYDRRFGPILDHPVDYFYHWMVEILADGNPEELGEYPYPSPVLRR